jgi:hypothetical protein
MNIINLIMHQLNHSLDMLNFKLACRLFQAIVQPLFRQSVAYFSIDKNTPRPNFTPFYEKFERFMDPFLIVQLLSIKSGDSDQHGNSDSPPISCLIMNSYKKTPLRRLILDITSLLFSPENFSDHYTQV